LASPDKTPRDYDRLELAHAAAIAQRDRYRSAHPTVAEVVRLRKIEEAAKELNDHWADVNWTYTVGHPYAQKLAEALKGAEDG